MTIMSALAVLMLLTALNCFPIFTLALHSRASVRERSHAESALRKPRRTYLWRMILSENRFPLFRIMR
jgi:hypothetical protein